MRKLISLIISASIFLQLVLPTASMVTYAAPQGLYDLKWESNKSLGDNLSENRTKTGEKEALVSWKVGDATGSYTLEYFIGNVKGAERVQLIFNRPDSNNIAKVGVSVFDKTGSPEDPALPLIKKYQKFNPDTARWEEMGEAMNEEDFIEVQSGGTYPGGRIRVGQTEIRFKWSSSGIMYVQTNGIELGNITPFKLKHDTLNPGESDEIEILAGLDKYKISPIHIKWDGEKIEDKKRVDMPGEEHPGIKPGVKIEFKRPQGFNETSYKFEEITSTKAEAIEAKLELAPLNGQPADLSFNLGNEADIKGLENSGKKLLYNKATSLYTLYLAKDDVVNGTENKNVVKWDTLEGSTILKDPRLGLKKKIPGKQEQPLGVFTPKIKPDEDLGGYTYLEYTIERSSLQDAYIQVQPYRDAEKTEFTYIIEAEIGGNWEPIVEHKHRPTSTNENTPIRIPIPFSPTGEKKGYKITVQYSQGIMSSQELYYKPKEDLTIPPPTPNIQSIDNIYAVPPRVLGEQPETIGFDLTWSAPKNLVGDKLLDILLEKGNIYYELFLHDTPETEEATGTLINVFEVSKKSPQDPIMVKPYGGTAGKDIKAVRYNESKNLFTMENIVLKKQKSPDNGSAYHGWEQIVDLPDDYDKEKTDYPEIKKVNVNDQLKGKEVPGIYYLTMRAVYDTAGAAIKMGVSNNSNPKSITISPLEEVIPVPTKIESKHFLDENDSDHIRQSVSWGNINLDRYTKQMLDPLNLSIAGQGKGVYEVYLYQNQKITASDLDATSPSGTHLDMTEPYDFKGEGVEALRKGKAVRLDYDALGTTGMNNVIFEGLDANQVYYVTIRVRLDIEDKDKATYKEKRHSVLSKQHTFTSYVKPNEPSPGERVPPVPENLIIIDQPNNATVKIGWDPADYSKQENEELYYEMIRIDARKLATEEDSRLFSIKNLLAKDGKNEFAAWRTKEPLVEKYTKSSATWSKALPDQESIKLQLEDPGLSPNQIYYYYVRTVLVEKGEEVYSSWVGIPVTTDPIQKPIHLKVENKEAYSHDPKREIVISFLAPIPKGANIPTDYDFDIAVQGEQDDEYKANYLQTRIISKEDDKDVPTGYSHYVYKINNLKPGKRYDIKVRITDKLLGQINGNYPKSLYSDRVTTRTHFDQDEQDKDDKFEEYLKYFENKVEALRRKPYWTLEDGVNRFSLKYRSDYIIPQINSTKTYKLDVREGVMDFSYHMPASLIAASNLNQTSFEITQGNVTYAIRPSTITTELDELKAALEDINEKYIRDYYVSFNFRQRPTSTRTGFLTPEISVNIELMRLKEEDLLIDDDIMDALNQEINKEKEIFIKDLERAQEIDKMLEEELEGLVNQSLAHIQKNHERHVRNTISRNTYKTVSIENWNKKMLIMATIEGNAIAQGYLLGKQDAALTTFNLGGGYGIEISQAGTYAFKGQKINIPVIPGVEGAGSLIAKYQLTDFFGINGTINPSNQVSKRNVLGAMARVLGAPKGADYIQYLKQMNVKGINNIGIDLPIKKGEGIYLLMQVYEKTHKKPINTVYIKNRNAVSNIRTFNQLHQPYVLVAVDSKLITIGTSIGPNDLMQIKDVLEVLSNIMATVR